MHPSTRRAGAKKITYKWSVTQFLGQLAVSAAHVAFYVKGA